MHFCVNCHNMYYLKIRDEDGGNTLNYYCRNCGHENTTLTAESICVSETQLRRSEQKYTHMVNEYTKFDPTLPRINTIKCPNQECSSNGAAVSISKKTKQRGGEKDKEDGSNAIASSGGMQDVQGGGGKSKKGEETKAKATAVQESVSAASAAVQEKANNREVIYIRYDDINMKYVYLCVHCDTTWKTDNRV